MYKIALQAGHYGRTTGSTGSPGEQELTARIWKNLSQQLIEKGFQVYMFGADPPIDATLKQDFDLFLALHGDADYSGDQGGGFADYPDPAKDFATAESQRICKILNESYFPETQIKYVNRSNNNTRYYYMWKYLTNDTPCVIIELGQTQDPHDKILLGNTSLIVNALGRAICKAFGVSYEVVPPSIDPHIAQIEELNRQILALKSTLSSQQTSHTGELAKVKADCQELITNNKLQFKADLEKFAKEY